MRKTFVLSGVISLIAFSAQAQAYNAPRAGDIAIVTTGTTAVTPMSGPYNGCYIVNPLTATDQGIMAAEPLYVNPVVAATTTGNGTNTAIAPGQAWNCPVGGTGAISVNAATTGHKFTVVRW